MRQRWIAILVVGAALLAVSGGVLWRRSARTIAASPPTANEAWAAPQPSATDWPWWRGGQSNGIATGNPPLKWSLSDNLTGTSGTNIAWRIPLPGRGHASPIVWRSQIFIATADESQQVISLLSIDRQNGRQNWSCEIQRGGLPKIHEKNSQASATPACDGRHVYIPYVADNRLWMTAVTMDGNIAWRTDAGPYRSNEGYASSPALHGSLVIVAADSKGAVLDRLGGAAFVAGLDCRSGEIVWRVKRPSLDSYGTPVVAQVCGRAQLLLSGGQHIVSYDPATGNELWKHEWPVDRSAGNPAFDQERVFVSATIWNAEIVCLRGEPSLPGDQSRQVWNLNKGVADVPVPLVLADRLFVLNDAGVLTCCSVADGKIHWKKRFKGPFSASPVSAAGRIYAANEEGRTFVIDPHSGDILSENQLPEPVFATPALAGQQIYIRTSEALYAIEQPVTDITLRPRPHATDLQAN